VVVKVVVAVVAAVVVVVVHPANGDKKSFG
jgi:hypothetical protein